MLTFLSGLGPLLAAIIVTRATEGSLGVRAIFSSMFNWKVKARWWMASVVLVAALFTVSVVLGMFTGGSFPNPSDGIYLNGGNLIIVVGLLLIGSFGEEPGWRGFALPKLQMMHSPLKATIILTFFWWLWHIPTYWTLPFSMEAAQQFGFFPAFAIQFIALLALGTLCAWVYNGSGGVILMPVLLHASWNFWSGAFGQEVSMFLLLLFLLTAIIVGIATRGKLGTSKQQIDIE